MENVLRSICVTLCQFIYTLIPSLYSVFYDLARGRFFTENTIDTIANNLYILVSVVMLFAFGVQLLKTIVNPDLLGDKQKGTVAFLKRAFLGILLIVLIPWAYDEIYAVQDHILSNSLVEKIIIGYNDGDSGAPETDSNKTEDKAGSIAKKSNAGQVLAASVIVDLLYPAEGSTTSSGEALQKAYNDMIQKDIKKIRVVGKSINEKYSPSGDEDVDDDQKEYVFEFQPLVAVLAGGFTVYMLILFCFDMGLRLVKLALLEITAPISIIAYIAVGDDILKRWYKEVFSTYVSVFIKIAGLAFLVLALQNINNYMKDIDADYAWMVKLFILFGILSLIKQFPDFISKLFGVNWTPKGGIKGRLAGMAAVGGVAANAWSKLGGVAKGAVTTAGAAGGAAVGWAGKKIGTAADNLTGNKISGALKTLKDSKVGRGAQVLNAGMKAGGGAASIKAMKDAANTQFAGEKWAKSTEKADKVKEAAKTKVRGQSGVYDANNKIDAAKYSTVTFDPTKGETRAGNVVKETTSRLKNVSSEQAARINKYQSDRHQNMSAIKDNTAANEISNMLKNAVNAESDATAKAKINGILNAFNSGGYATTADLSSALYGATSSALTVDVQNAINNVASDMGNFGMSLDGFSRAVSDSQAKLSASEKSYNEMLDKATDSQKVMIKEVTAMGKELSKKDLGL